MSTNDPGAGAGVQVDPQSAPASGSPGASPAPGSAAASPAASPAQDGNIRQLREQYEATKREYEPYRNLGAKPEELQRSHQTYQKIHTEATTLGQNLGYDPQEVLDALAKDPVNTLAVLRQMAQQARGTEKPLTREDVQRLADERAKEALKPFQQEREQQLDQKAESAFDGEIGRQIKTSFPNGLPEKNSEALSGLAWALLLENREGYDALRGKGETAAVATAFDKAKTTLLAIHAEWGEFEKKRISGEPRPERTTAATGKKTRSFAEIAADLNDDSIPLDRALGR